MSDFYRFLDFSRQVLLVAIFIFSVYYGRKSNFKDQKRKSMTPYELFNDRALEFGLDNVSVASFLLTLKYTSQKDGGLETDWVLFDSYLNYFNSLIKDDLEYGLEQFKLIADSMTDNDMVNIDYIKERVEEKKKAREEKEGKITLVVISIIIVIGLYYWAVDTDNTETFYTVLVVGLLIVFAILGLWFNFIDNDNDDLNWWQILIKYLFFSSIIGGIVAGSISMIGLPFTIISMILLGILGQLKKMNNKQ